MGCVCCRQQQLLTDEAHDVVHDEVHGVDEAHDEMTGEEPVVPEALARPALGPQQHACWKQCISANAW